MIYENPIEVKKFVETLTLITDFAKVKEGEKIFNKHSLSVDYFDTFISYDNERDIIKYKNSKGEVWQGEGADCWYFC